jgi:hypothetical protein
MNEKIVDLINRIKSLEIELKNELEKEQKKIKFSIQNGHINFSADELKKQKELFTDIFTYLKETPVLFILSAPIIYSLIVPAVILDIFVFVYQQINFRIYKIAIVKRDQYIVFDRQYLAYLNTIEKLNCLYCSYFNGLMTYVGEVAARTEQYWCPIKHAKKIAYKHRHYDLFLPYGDAKSYHQSLQELRKRLADEKEL